MTEARDLADVLADVLEEAAILDRNGAAFSAARVRELVANVKAAAEEWMTWLSESDAAMRAGFSKDWMRGRFEAMRREGHARFNGRDRQYRACAVPRRANTVVASAKGRNAARQLKAAS